MKRGLVLVSLTLVLLLTSACAGLMADASPDNPVAETGDTKPVSSSTRSTDAAKGEASADVERQANWDEDSHDKSADPDYETVFPQDAVNRIDITITPETWQAMMDNMTELYGESGTRAAGMGGQGERQFPRNNAPGRRSGGGESENGQAPVAPDDAQSPFQGAPGEGMPEGGFPEGGMPEGGFPEDGMPEGEIPEGGMPQGGRPFQDGEGAMGGGMVMDGGENPDYAPVTITFEGETWEHVGMRFKGNSSLRSAWNNGTKKFPFRLDFDEFEDEYPEIEDQRFYGFKQLAFSGGFGDSSFLREKVTADIFRSVGVPAAQTAFYEVYVDYGEGPIYFGLYTLTEIVDDTVVETQFEDDDGNVYKPSGTGATFAAGTFSEASFEKQSNEDEADWSDIIAVFDALHDESRTRDPAAWRSELEAVFDVDEFLNWLAVNTVVQNWDTYGSMSHNYYLYHDPATDRIVWIPWDNNEALSSHTGRQSVTSIDLEAVTDRWPLIRYLLDDEVYHAIYVDHVDALIHGAFDPEQMEATYRAYADLIEPYVLSENEMHTYLKSDADFYAAIEVLVEHAYDRCAEAEAFIASRPQ